MPEWLQRCTPVDSYSLYTKSCTGEFSEQEVRKLKAFYYAAYKRTDAMLGVLIFLKKILIFRSKVRVGVGGKEKKA